MRAIDCFLRKVDLGVVDRNLGMNLVDEIVRLEKERGEAFARREATASVAATVADEASRMAARKAELALANIEKRLEVARDVAQYRAVWDSLGPDGRPLWMRNPGRVLGQALKAFLADDRAEIAGRVNVVRMAETVRGEAHGMMRDAILALRPANLGFTRQRALELEVLQVLKDPSAQVSAVARTAAEGWARTAEHLRRRFVDELGALPERKGWALPNPAHMRAKVMSVPVDEWIGFVRPKLDRASMLDFATGRPLSDDRLTELLRDMYRDIVTGSAGDVPGRADPARPLASRRAEMRFLSFRQAEDWIDYDARFGDGAGVYDTMMRHIADMADDIAMLKVLGPDPEGLKAYMLSLFDLEAARWARQGSMEGDGGAAGAAFRDNTRVLSRVAAERRSFETLWDEVTGANKVPVSTVAAAWSGEARSGLVATQLGSAMLSAVSDAPLAMMSARFVDTPAWGVLSRAIEGLKSNELEVTAAQYGMISDSLSLSLRQGDRFMGETISTGKAAQVASAVLRASGLRRWTASMRAAFYLETAAAAANRLEMRHGDLPEGFRGMLARSGIEAPDWDIIRQAIPSEERPGARLLTPADIRAIDHPEAADLADRWGVALHRELGHAVIEGDARSRALLLGQSRPGTLEGEVRRFAGQYKSFPLTVMLLIAGRATARGWDGDRLGHAALTFAAMTMLGAFSMQAKHIANGKDPVSLDPSTGIGVRAWGAAVLQGGGLGIFGDLLFQDQTRMGTTYAAALAGPAAGLVEKSLGDFLMRNIQKAAKGEPTQFSGDALYLAAGLVPGNNLWPFRLAFQRTVVDQLALMIDERAPERFDRLQREAEKNWEQEFWWQPGRADPRRAVDLSAAFGSR